MEERIKNIHLEIDEGGSTFNCDNETLERGGCLKKEHVD
jgi:hypothetical protein